MNNGTPFIPHSYFIILINKMKKREIQKFKNMPVAELKKLLKEGRERLRSLKFSLAAGKVKNVQELRSLHKDLARIHTFISIAERAK